VPKTPQVPYLRVADALRERLDGGEWLPGEPMPSVSDIGTQYNVSRSTAARAINVLAGEGRLTVVPSWGSFVAS
jgi:GntR family transcriptional regulator